MIMTVKELFLSVSFKQIAEVLARMSKYSLDLSIRNRLSGYKEAYDAICNLEPLGDGSEVFLTSADSISACSLLKC